MFIVLLLISSFLGYPLLRCAREFMGILISLFVTCRLSCVRNSCFLSPFQSIFKIARLTEERLTEEAFECNVDAYKKCLSSDDAKIVMKKLGLLSSKERHDDGNCGDCHLLSGVYHLLEEKEASLGELEEAFTVFDENGDGFISPKELQRVMRMLGLKEGMKLEECEKMIRAYDEDGDGRICFREFKAILEYAT